MDSLRTGSTQSWFIVAAVAFSPVIVLFLADAIGWLIRRRRVERDGNAPAGSPGGASGEGEGADWRRGDATPTQY
jgi:hypothetical protein